MSVEKVMSEKEANKVIAEKMAQVRVLISECEKIATENNVAFSMDVAYGMGGWFESGEWNPSSQSC